MVNASPVKTNVPTSSSSSVVLSQATERLTKDTLSLQKSGPVGAAGEFLLTLIKCMFYLIGFI